MNEDFQVLRAKSFAWKKILQILFEVKLDTGFGEVQVTKRFKLKMILYLSSHFIIIRKTVFEKESLLRGTTTTKIEIFILKFSLLKLLLPLEVIQKEIDIIQTRISIKIEVISICYWIFILVVNSIMKVGIYTFSAKNLKLNGYSRIEKSLKCWFYRNRVFNWPFLPLSHIIQWFLGVNF